MKQTISQTITASLLAENLSDIQDKTHSIEVSNGNMLAYLNRQNDEFEGEIFIAQLMHDAIDRLLCLVHNWNIEFAPRKPYQLCVSECGEHLVLKMRYSSKNPTKLENKIDEFLNAADEAREMIRLRMLGGY